MSRGVKYFFCLKSYFQYNKYLQKPEGALKIYPFPKNIFSFSPPYTAVSISLARYLYSVHIMPNKYKIIAAKLVKSS